MADREQKTEILTEDSMLRLPELQQHVPLSRSTIYRLVSSGDFPRPKQLGPRCIAWRWGEVVEWLRTRGMAEPGSRAV